MTEAAVHVPENEKVAQTVGILVLDGDRVLAIRNGIDSRQNYGSYNLPGGHVEEGETSEEAAIREFEEETGLKTDSDHLLEFPGNTFQAKVVLRNDEENLRWKVFLCTGYSGKMRPEGRDGQKSIPEWMSVKDLTLLVETLPNIDQVIHNAQQFMGAEK